MAKIILSVIVNIYREAIRKLETKKSVARNIKADQMIFFFPVSVGRSMIICMACTKPVLPAPFVPLLFCLCIPCRLSWVALPARGQRKNSATCVTMLWISLGFQFGRLRHRETCAGGVSRTGFQRTEPRQTPAGPTKVAQAQPPASEYRTCSLDLHAPPAASLPPTPDFDNEPAART